MNQLSIQRRIVRQDLSNCSSKPNPLNQTDSTLLFLSLGPAHEWSGVKNELKSNEAAHNNKVSFMTVSVKQSGINNIYL